MPRLFPKRVPPREPSYYTKVAGLPVPKRPLRETIMPCRAQVVFTCLALAALALVGCNEPNKCPEPGLALNWPSTPSAVDFSNKPGTEGMALQPQKGVNYMWMATVAEEGQTLEGNCQSFVASFATTLKADPILRMEEAHGISQCRFEVHNRAFSIMGSMAERDGLFHLAYATLEGTAGDAVVVGEAKAFTQSLRFE